MSDYKTHKGVPKFARVYMGAPPKEGKTGTAATLRAVVSRPQDLAFISCDPGGLDTLGELVRLDPKIYGWLNEATVEDLEQECAGITVAGPGESPVYDKFMSICERLRLQWNKEPQYIHALWVSGTGTLADAIKREVRFGVGNGPADEMNQFRWDKYGNRIDNIRAKAHGLPGHVIWEVQVLQLGDGDPTHLIQGKQSALFGMSCTLALHLTRKLGSPGKWAPREFNTQPGWPWMKTSRREALLDRMEPADFGVIFKKLGLPMGGEPKPAA